jgi:glycyl-tRNA synthetase
VRDHEQAELSHYSNATSDIEYLFPFGWGELWGIADRTDFDLTAHNANSDEDLTFFDQENNRRYIPYCIEPSVGVERLMLAFLCDAYDEEDLTENGKADSRTVLRLHPALAPIKAAVLPLSKKLAEGAMKVYRELAGDYFCDYDDSGSIGKRYRRQDEAGTPFCVTYDFDTEAGGPVTVRERDSMKQDKVSLAELKLYLAERLKF